MAKDDYKNWLKEAEWDLETSEILKENGRYNSASFYSQQSVEKLLKATLLFKNEAPWRHSTRELLIRLNQITKTDLSKLLHYTS
jgi:HEPN domain-containing protein